MLLMTLIWKGLSLLRNWEVSCGDRKTDQTAFLASRGLVPPCSRLLLLEMDGWGLHHEVLSSVKEPPLGKTENMN